MKTRFCKNSLASALLLGLAACGGGGDAPDEGTAQAQQAEAAGPSNEDVLGGAADAGRAQALAVGGPAVGTLASASSNAAGRARGGIVCDVSADGTLVAFESQAANIVAGDTNGRSDVFVKNLRTGPVTRVSTSSSGAQLSQGGSCGIGSKAMSQDGRVVLFSAEGQVFAKNLATGTVSAVSPPLGSVPNVTGFVPGAISDDGRKVVFQTVPAQVPGNAAFTFVNVVPSRLMVRDLATASLTTAVTDDGVVANGEVSIGGFAISPDGRQIAFVSTSRGLAAGDTNAQPDVFVHELSTGATRLVSSNNAGVPATPSFCCNSFYSNIRFVSNQSVQFESTQPSSLGPRGDYVKDLGIGALRLVLDGSAGASESFVSADGNTVAFSRGYSGFDRRVFVRNLSTGQEQLVSASTANAAANASSTKPRVSGDGSSVVFMSNASNLVSPTPPAGSFQVYVKTIAATSLPGL